jgi:hypothetical protein
MTDDENYETKISMGCYMTEKEAIKKAEYYNYDEHPHFWVEEYKFKGEECQE